MITFLLVMVVLILLFGPGVIFALFRLALLLTLAGIALVGLFLLGVI